MAGSESTSVEIPPWLEEPTRATIKRGEQVANIGYVPYYGPELAAFTPQQNAAFANTNAAADAFGLSGGANAMPTPTQYAGGMQGYSSQPLLEQSQYQLYQERPNQYGYQQSFFIDPVAPNPNSPYGGGDYRPLPFGSDPVTAQPLPEWPEAEPTPSGNAGKGGLF